MAKEPSLSDAVTRERETVTDLLSNVRERMKALEDEEATLLVRLKAADVYEAALTGKAPTKRQPTGTRTPGRSANLLALIKNSDGLKRADILEKMGVKGDKSAENSVSTALTGLKKQKKIDLTDGIYKAL